MASFKNVIKGAVVVSTQKGEILALLSRPSLTLTLYNGKLVCTSTGSVTNLNDILLDAKTSRLDRAISEFILRGQL